MAGRLQLTLLAGICAAAIAGCGSNDEGTIPAADSEQLTTLLDAVEGDVASGDCDVAEKRAQQFVDQVNLLPAEVEDKVKGGLQEAAARLRELVSESGQCEQTTGPSGESGAEPTTGAVEPAVEPEVTEPTTDTTTEPAETSPENDGAEGGGETSNGPPESPPGNGPPAGSNAGGNVGSGGIEIGP